jgi:hypothetical protein
VSVDLQLLADIGSDLRKGGPDSGKHSEVDTREGKQVQSRTPHPILADRKAVPRSFRGCEIERLGELARCLKLRKLIAKSLAPRQPDNTGGIS